MKELSDTGWKMIHALLFTHPKHGNLYHENGNWYWARPRCAGERIADTLRKAIPVILERTAQGVLV